MHYIFVLFLSLIFSLPVFSETVFESSRDLPAAYQGRFRSLDSVARLWLYDFYHQDQIKNSDLQAFQAEDRSALDLLWRIHFLGHLPYDDSPFFWVHFADVKTILGLDKSKDRFSYHELLHAQAAISAIDVETLEKDAKKTAEELLQVNQMVRLFEELDGQHLKDEESYLQEFKKWQQLGTEPKEIERLLERQFPLMQRLQRAGSTLKLLPSRHFQGEWLSLHAFRVRVYDRKQNQLLPVGNFTAYTDEDFEILRSAYFEIEKAFLRSDALALQQSLDYFVIEYMRAYSTFEERPYKEASGKKLYYPTANRLQAETLYYRLPLIELAVIFYLLALIFWSGVFWGKGQFLKRWAISSLAIGFALHTVVLVFRCYILQRPPVSNMFETIVYVPWIAMVIGWFFYYFSKSQLILFSACIGSLVLLILLKLTNVNARMENVQAVLDSQYWLIVHVLMVVGSYGAFVVSGILGHVYLLVSCLSKRNEMLHNIARGILHTMYVGVALLIPGTILGGVWAAESWGRFWDWDPKESWAFISACVYLIVIHAYTFHRIRDFGLAVGSIAGLMAISFTWYGVNYVLGTGLHSYGFGNGGEKYYFIYLLAETLFLLGMTYFRPRRLSEQKTP